MADFANSAACNELGIVQRTLKFLEPASWSSGNAFVSGAGGLRIKSRTGQIEHSVANGSPPLLTFLQKELHPNEKVSYSQYQKVFKEMNIGFNRPSQDDCDMCLSFKNKDHHQPECSCDNCEKLKQHRENFEQARIAYQNDRECSNTKEGHIVLAADMQKVIMLPKMSIKSQYFLSRLTVFNETFCRLDGLGDYCVLWHEAISGRCASDVTSAYVEAMLALSAHSSFTFWCDNCSAQNKNWTLFCGLWLFAQQLEGPEEIEIKYLEKGHTYMRPDSIHGSIGAKMKKISSIFDWQDLTEVVSQASKGIRVINMRPQHIYQFRDFHIKSKNMPKISSLKAVKVAKNSRKLFFKANHQQKVYFEEEFVSRHQEASTLPPSILKERGMNTKKKDAIVKVLVPHMPPGKAAFWKKLPTSDFSVDLGAERDNHEI